MSSVIQIWKTLTNSEKKISVLLVFFMVVAMLFEIIGIGALIPLASILVGEQNSLNIPLIESFYQNYFDKNEKNNLIFFIIFFGFIIIVKNFFLIFSTWFNSKNLQNLCKRISQELFRKYLQAPYLFHSDNNSSKLIYNCTDCTYVFKEASGHLIILFSEIMVLIGISLFLLYLEPAGFLVSSSIMIIIGLIYFRINKNRLFEIGKKIELNEKEKIKSIMQGLGGIKIIKILKKEDYFIKIFNKFNFQSNYYKFLAGFITNLPRFILEIIVVIFASLSLIFLSFKNVSGTEIFLKISIFAFAAFRLLPSLNRIISSYEKFRVCKFQINTIYNQIKLPFKFNNILEHEKKLINLEAFERLRLENVNFKYSNTSKFIFKNISLEINKGDYIGIVGKTGSGKSTLIDMMTGLLNPLSGNIKINDINIKKIRNWEKKIGYVPQFIYLIDDTLKKNIALGFDENEIDENKVFESIKEADLLGFLNNLPQGADQIMGERGIKISGGEMQRIGLARSIYNNPDVLIFDEFTSSLDLKTEEGILDNIKKYKGKKTIIIISHKLSTLKDCDKIIEINNGEIKEKI